MFSVMSDILEFSDNIIEIHHQKRRVGWLNVPSGDSIYQPRMELLCVMANAPLKFINEREYEALKIIDLLREVAAQEVAYVSQFNRRYKFKLHPMPGSNTQQGGSSDWYYAALEVTALHKHQPGANSFASRTRDASEDDRVFQEPKMDGYRHIGLSSEPHN